MNIPYPTFAFEKTYWDNDIPFVIGLDEVGRGAFAGPVVVSSVVFPSSFSHPKSERDVSFLNHIHDSKLLSASQRDHLAQEITHHAIHIGMGSSSVETINEVGITKATHLAFQQAFEKILPLLPKPFAILIDGLPIPFFQTNYPTNTMHVIKGDQKSRTIAAASIIAKVYRDNLMTHLAASFPSYGWEKNKGYGTLQHRNALKSEGKSPYHRKYLALEQYA